MTATVNNYRSDQTCYCIIGKSLRTDTNKCAQTDSNALTTDTNTRSRMLLSEHFSLKYSTILSLGIRYFDSSGMFWNGRYFKKVNCKYLLSLKYKEIQLHWKTSVAYDEIVRYLEENFRIMIALLHSCSCLPRLLICKVIFIYSLSLFGICLNKLLVCQFRVTHKSRKVTSLN